MQVVTAGSLAGAAFFQFFIDHIADAPPSHAPVGEVRRFFRRPADETLEDRIGPAVFEEGHDAADVLFAGPELDLSLGIPFGHGRVLNDVQGVELDFVRAEGGNDLGCLDGVFHGVPGQVEDDMRTGPERILPEHDHGVDVFGNGMAAVDLGQGLIVDRLQAQFDEDIDAVPFFDVSHDIEIGLVETVRPGRYGQGHDIGLAGGGEVIPETLWRQVGIGEILEIGDEFIGLVLGLDVSHVLLDLLANGHRRRQVLVAGADGTAEGTAPDAQGPVAVGTGIGDADRQFIDFFAICFF